MHGLKKMLLAEQMRLEKIIQAVKKQLENSPEGKLRISGPEGKRVYYHWREEGEKYISKQDTWLIQQLAQKAYNEKLLKCAEKRLSQIRRLARNYDDNEIEKIYLSESAERRKWITPAEPTREQRVENWLAEEYQGKAFSESDPTIFTDKGERVRSKSEKILADYFYRNHIPYKYEHPLNLTGYGTVYPDFTFLSPVTGSEIYWEHNGRMDDPTYARSAVKKILLYEKNNIFVGDRLIMTYETEQTVLSTKAIETMVLKYLLPKEE